MIRLLGEMMLVLFAASREKGPPCPDRLGRDDGPRDLSPDPQGFRSSGPCSNRARRAPPSSLLKIQLNHFTVLAADCQNLPQNKH